MKTIKIILFGCLVMTYSANAQWGGTNPVYFNAGNVGIGTTTPSIWFGAKTLEFSDTRPVFKLSSTSPTGLSTLVFTNSNVNSSTHYGEFHFNYAYNSTNNDKSALHIYGYPAGNILSFQADGNIGIATSTPSEKLDVVGKVKIGTGGSDYGLIYHTSDQSETGYANVWPDQYERALMLKANAYFDGYGAGGGGFQFWTYDKTEGGTWGSYTGNLKQAMVIRRNGNVAIGTADPKGYKLAVAGKIISEEIVVKLQGNWPDYVFEKDYKLPSLEELQLFIAEHKHLPGVPSAKEVEENGLAVGEMNAVLLKKIEELTLHLIEQKKEIQELQSELKKIKK